MYCYLQFTWIIIININAFTGGAANLTIYHGWFIHIFECIIIIITSNHWCLVMVVFPMLITPSSWLTWLYLCYLLALLHHADPSVPYARPPGGLPPLGGDRWHSHPHYLYDVHEHVHWQRPNLWLELWLPQNRGGEWDDQEH